MRLPSPGANHIFALCNIFCVNKLRWLCLNPVNEEILVWPQHVHCCFNFSLGSIQKSLGRSMEAIKSRQSVFGHRGARDWKLVGQLSQETLVRWSKPGFDDNTSKVFFWHLGPKDLGRQKFSKAVGRFSSERWLCMSQTGLSCSPNTGQVLQEYILPAPHLYWFNFAVFVYLGFCVFLYLCIL